MPVDEEEVGTSRMMAVHTSGLQIGAGVNPVEGRYVIVGRPDGADKAGGIAVAGIIRRERIVMLTIHFAHNERVAGAVEDMCQLLARIGVHRTGFVGHGWLTPKFGISFVRGW